FFAATLEPASVPAALIKDKTHSKDRVQSHRPSTRRAAPWSGICPSEVRWFSNRKEREMKFRCSGINPGQVCRTALIWIFALAVSIVAEPGHAQTRKPTAQEIAAIHDCAGKNADNDKGEQRCLFRLVADRCIGDAGAASNQKLADCYRIEGLIWDD